MVRKTTPTHPPRPPTKRATLPNLLSKSVQVSPVHPFFEHTYDFSLLPHRGFAIEKEQFSALSTTTTH
jgi:hypothetical protein